jgi:hypothetical protein
MLLTMMPNPACIGITISSMLFSVPASDRDRIRALSKLQAWPPCYGAVGTSTAGDCNRKLQFSRSFLSLALVVALFLGHFLARLKLRVCYTNLHALHCSKQTKKGNEMGGLQQYRSWLKLSSKINNYASKAKMSPFF